MTVGSIISETWRIMRGNPRTILIWSVIQLLIGVVIRLGWGPFYQAQAAVIAARAQGLPADPPPFGQFVLVWLAVMLVMLVLYNAAFRMVLFPERRAFAYLRVGMDELRLVGLMLALGIAFMVVGGLAMLLMMLVGAGVAVGLGIGRVSTALMTTGLMLVIYGGMAFVSVRLVVAAPLTLYRGKITIGPAWSLTRGRFWTLFGAFLVVAVATMVVGLIIMLPAIRPLIDAIGQGGDAGAQQRLAEFQAQQMSLSASPTVLAQLAFAFVAGGPMLALFGGMPAVATRQLLAEQLPQPDGSARGPWSDPR